MQEKQSSQRDLGGRIAHIGNSLIALEKKVEAKIAELKIEMGQMFEHFEGQRLRQEFRHEARPVSQDDSIPYQPFPDKLLGQVEAWEKKVLASSWKEPDGRLPNLVYVGEDEYGVPMVADFEVQIRLPALYLMVAKQRQNRYNWMRENPYEEWRKQWVK